MLGQDRSFYARGIVGNLFTNEGLLKLYPSLAKDVGIIGAIFVQQITYWIEKKPIVINREKWCKNTMKQWKLQLPFVSTNTIKRSRKKLSDLGFIKIYKVNYYKLKESLEHTFMGDNYILISPSVAIKIGLNEAIFLQRLHYWIRKTNFQKNGVVWVYNTYEEWQKQLPFFCIKTIKTIVYNLAEKGIVNVRRFAGEVEDERINYYSINYLRLNEICDGSEDQEQLINDPKITIEIVPDCAIPEKTILDDPVAKKDRPKIKAKKDSKYTADFLLAWSLYPARGGSNSKINAFVKWKILCNDGVNPADLISAARNYKNFCDAKDKTGTEFVMRAERFFGPAREYERFVIINEGDCESLYRKKPTKLTYREQLREYAKENNIEVDF